MNEDPQPLVPQAQPDPDILLDIVHARMPFGKYQGRPLRALPEAYLVWMSQRGFPSGRLGQLLETVLVMKHNGLMGLLDPVEKMVADSTVAGARRAGGQRK